jgi:hypothetical protein
MVCMVLQQGHSRSQDRRRVDEAAGAARRDVTWLKIERAISLKTADADSRPPMLISDRQRCSALMIAPSSLLWLNVDHGRALSDPLLLSHRLVGDDVATGGAVLVMDRLQLRVHVGRAVHRAPLGVLAS